ncbi:PKD domain containing protein [Actinoplanes sp. NPDC026619]|uniref:PKD domain containing protein n=1 Tax=Actinoplanes sp. NPDC026619 TaxID=3155798 RepID=UPI0033F4BCF7
MRRRLLAGALVVLAVIACGASSAAADLAQPSVVSENPVDYTPHVLDGTVWALAVVGDTVVVGGAFTAVADSSRRYTYARRNLFAFDLRSGAIRAFAPVVDGPVYALAAGDDGTVYAGGAFGRVNGSAQRGVARVGLDGGRLSSFRASIDRGFVQTLARRGRQLYVGGTFGSVNGVRRVGLARVDAVGGRVDPDFDAGLTSANPHRTHVENLDVSPDGRSLVVIGGFLGVRSLQRNQIALLDISGPAAAVTGWYTDAFQKPCQKGYDAYLRQVKFAPDGSWFVVVTTGGTSQNLCDSAVRFQAAGTGQHDPFWVQHTGGNSLFAVAVTGAAVYLGGHQEYLDNPDGHKTKNVGEPPDFRPGPGAVSRPGIGAVDSATGRALTWNPTRSRGTGVRVLLPVPQGLLVGSDTDELGHEYHGRIGMFPLG